MEPQILKVEQIPEKIPMRLENLSVDEDDERFQAKLEECDLSDETADAFFESADGGNPSERTGYDVPVTAGGIRSMETAPIYNRE